MGVEAPQPSGGTIDPADLTALAARERLTNGSLRVNRRFRPGPVSTRIWP
jgi:hypothetical protein